MIWLASLAWAQGECPSLDAPRNTVQVAWISPVRRTVGNNRDVQVVLVDDLADWVDDNKADQTRLLQALDRVGKRGGWRARRLYKVTLFEVPSEELCRPLDDVPEGEVVDGVRACGDTERKTPCGHTVDVITGEQGLTVYSIPWRDAARWGFCVIPLQLFLEEL